MKKTLVLFDVDGTLTKSNKVIKQKTIDILLKLRKKVDLGIISSSNIEKQKEQLLEKNFSLFKYIFSENGLVGFKNGDLINKTSIINELGEEKIKILINKALEYMSKLDIPKKRGTFVEFRNGMINLCPVGRSCSLSERLEFFEYDNKHNIRVNMVKHLSEELKDLNLSFSIGGQISIDVFPKGWDKTYCLQFVKDEYSRILFFGDRTNKGGNDYEIYNSELTEGYAINSPEETISKLNELFDLQ